MFYIGHHRASRDRPIHWIPNYVGMTMKGKTGSVKQITTFFLKQNVSRETFLKD